MNWVFVPAQSCINKENPFLPQRLVSGRKKKENEFGFRGLKLKEKFDLHVYIFFYWKLCKRFNNNLWVHATTRFRTDWHWEGPVQSCVSSFDCNLNRKLIKKIDVIKNVCCMPTSIFPSTNASFCLKYLWIMKNMFQIINIWNLTRLFTSGVYS